VEELFPHVVRFSLPENHEQLVLRSSNSQGICTK